MGAIDYVRVADGRSTCRIQDPAGAPVDFPVLELSSMGGLLGRSPGWNPEVGAYVDCAVSLAGVGARQLFATVANVGERGVTVRWMATDPGDESKVRELIAAYVEAGKRPAAAQAGHGTRRIIRPSGQDAAPAAGEADAAKPSADQRVGTRRILRPSGRAPAEAAGSAPAAQPSAKSPGSSTQTAIAPFSDGSAAKPAPAGDAAAAASPPAAAAQAAPAGQPGGPVAEATPITVPVDPGVGSSGSRTAVITKDGRMDIGASIRSRSQTVMAADLAAKHQKVRVLNMGTIKALIQEAVEEAASHLTQAMGEAERKRLLEETEKGFQERLKEFELQKASAEERAKLLMDQLKSAQNLLEDERKRSIQAEQFTVSDAGLVEIDKRMAKTLERVVRGGGVTPELEEQLRGLVAHVLDTEREKIRQKELEAQNAKIELLEKKVKRLANTLEETERQRDDYQTMLSDMEKSGGGGGLRSIMKAGIKGDDPAKAKKLELMKTILEENRALRDKLGIKLNQVADVVQQAAVDAGVMTASEAKDAVAAPPPAPAAEAAAEPAVADDGGSAADGVNPDDMPWEAQPMSFAGGENEHGVKKMAIADPLAFTPPPLERGAAAPAEDAAPAAAEVDPDDMPWEGQPMSFAGGENEHGVKKMAIADPLAFTPPPLERDAKKS